MTVPSLPGTGAAHQHSNTAPQPHTSVKNPVLRSRNGYVCGLACTSVNFCVHSSTVRQNGAGFGYGITSIAQYGSGEPLGAAGDPPIIDPYRKRRRFGAI